MQLIRTIIFSFSALLICALSPTHAAEELANVPLASLSPDPTPANLAPADLAPADLAPADLAPADLAPADLAPADLGPNDLALEAVTVDDIDLWGRIRKGFGISDLDNPLVASQTAWFAGRPDYIQRSTTRASRYLYHVVEELEKRHMPTELALLPFVESAFDPQAFSSAKAAGIWQFMPSTGLHFKLKQNMFKDERRDVLASTDAALTYLQNLYDIFGDWQLALAAYNWGEGSVQRAINKNRAAHLPTDFNSLSARMPLETRNYVPKLQAIKNIISHPEQYGIVLPQLENQPYFVSVDETRDIDVKIAAQLAELPIEEFQALNPQFNRPVITSDTPILLPETNADKFNENLTNWGHALSSWTSHTIASTHENIETIASRFGTTPALIREVNHIPPRTHLKIGSTILVPKSAAAEESDIAPEVAANAQMVVEPDANVRRIFVRVGTRDSLQSVAAHNRVSVAQLVSWNNLRQNRVFAGQRLQIQIAYRRNVARNVNRRVALNVKHRAVAVRRPAHHGKILVASSKGAKKRPA